MIFAAPLFVLVGGGGTRLRRPRRRRSAASCRSRRCSPTRGSPPARSCTRATTTSTGSRSTGYPTLGYHAGLAGRGPALHARRTSGSCSARCPRSCPDVLPDTLGYYPTVKLCTEPGAVRGLFETCPLAVPVDIGTSLLLSAPGPAAGPVRDPALRARSRLAIGTAAAVLLIGLFNLAHFSQGWVQWGYRFSLDFMPFLLPLVALGAARPSDGRPRLIAFVLVMAGVFVNLWGVTWGQLLGW